MTEAELAELFRSVLARPDDHDQLRVYADALLERGDPRGELIVLQLSPPTAQGAARERELCAQLSDALKAQLQQPAAAIIWRHGFVDAIDFTPVAGCAPLAESLGMLGTMAIARRLRRMVIRSIRPGYGPLIGVNTRLTSLVPKWPAFRELVVTQRGEQPFPTSFGRIATVANACPKLEVLELGTSDFIIYDARLPNLKRLVLERLSLYDLRWVVEHEWPKLTELDLDFQEWDLRDREEMDRFATWNVPLRMLTLRSRLPMSMQNLCDLIPRSPIARNLRVLGLRGGLEDNCITALFESARNLKLERLEIDTTDAGTLQWLRENLPFPVVEA